MALALEAQGDSLFHLDEAVSSALKSIVDERDSFGVIYFEADPQGLTEWIGLILRKIGLGPWLPTALGPRIRVLLTGRIQAAPKNGTPLGSYQIPGLENVIEGNPSRFYDLTEEQIGIYEAEQTLHGKIELMNGWLKAGVLQRKSDLALYQNFLSELQQTAYSHAQISAVLRAA
jgi:hypothetical protein